MQAVIQTGGKQYSVQQGSIIKTEKLEGAVGDSVEFKDIPMVDDGSKLILDTGSCVVKGTILEQKKDDKVVVFKKKRRTTYKRKKGHRQNVTVVRITDVSAA